MACDISFVVPAPFELAAKMRAGRRGELQRAVTVSLPYTGVPACVPLDFAPLLRTGGNID